jgi:hypothetical protein
MILPPTLRQLEDPTPLFRGALRYIEQGERFLQAVRKGRSAHAALLEELRQRRQQASKLGYHISDKVPLDLIARWADVERLTLNEEELRQIEIQKSWKELPREGQLEAIFIYLGQLRLRPDQRDERYPENVLGSLEVLRGMLEIGFTVDDASHYLIPFIELAKENKIRQNASRAGNSRKRVRPRNAEGKILSTKDTKGPDGRYKRKQLWKSSKKAVDTVSAK